MLLQILTNIPLSNCCKLFWAHSTWVKKKNVNLVAHFSASELNNVLFKIHVFTKNSNWRHTHILACPTKLLQCPSQIITAIYVNISEMFSMGIIVFRGSQWTNILFKVQHWMKTQSSQQISKRPFPKAKQNTTNHNFQTSERTLQTTCPSAQTKGCPNSALHMPKVSRF